MPRAPDPALAHLSDEQLDAHIAHLESWLAFELVDIAEAVRERIRRGRGALALSIAAEDYLVLQGRAA